jgi:hypothetical protein
LFPLIATGVADTGGKFMLLIPAAFLPPESLTPVAKFATSVVDTGLT